MGQIGNVPLDQRRQGVGCAWRAAFQRSDMVIRSVAIALGSPRSSASKQGLLEDVRITRRHQFGECARPALGPGNLLAAAERVEDARRADRGGRRPRSASSTGRSAASPAAASAVTARRAR